MNTTIVQNFLRRWGIVIGLCSAAQLAFTYFASTRETGNIFFPLILFMGPVLLSFDLSKGIARAILLLPVQRREVTKTLCWIGIGLPTLWVAILSVCSMTASVVFDQTVALDWSRLIQTVITAFASLSIVYFALTGLPTNVKEAQEWSARSLFFGALWGFSIGGSMLFSQLVDRSENNTFSSYLLFLIVGIGFAFWGYQRTDDMLSSRSTGRSESRPGPSAPRKSFFDFDSEATGFNHFIVTTVTQVFVFSIVFIVATSVFNTLFLGMLTGQRMGNTSWIDSTVRSLSGQSFIFVVMPSFFLATKLMAARVFRSLPLSASQLSNQFFKLVVISIIAQIILLFTIMTLLTDLASAQKLSKEFFMMGGIGTLIIPLILRFGLKSTTLVVAMPIVFLSALGRIFLPEIYSTNTSIIIGIVAIIVSRFLTEWLLATSSHAYHQLNQQKFANAFYGKG